MRRLRRHNRKSRFRRICRNRRKAAPSLWAVERRRRAWPKRWRITGRAKLSGLVVTRYGHNAPTRKIEVVEAAHPVPDLAGRQAAERILKMVQGLSADDLVLFLVSGGGSALLALPAPGLTLARQAGDQQGAAQERRQHRGDELRTQAPFRGQGRTACRRLRTGESGDAGHFRHSGRRSGGHRLRSYRG